MPPAPVIPPSLEQCIPLAALSQPDDSDQLTQPEVGDAVDYTVTGKVTRIEGDMAYVMAEAVNGQDVKAATPTPAAEAETETLQSLESAAQEMT